ncbi:MAG TPA: ComF family protein [Terriglobales bacterium]|nr:ComF family protein [Terriglobales bacterium]
MATQGLFATLFPSDCRLCGTILTSISRLPVCQACLEAIRPISGQTCSVCGERLFSPHFTADDVLCGLCRREAPPFERAVAYGSYDGGLRELVHLLKYDRVRPAAGVLGRMLAGVVTGLAGQIESALVIPVPLHASKVRQRGFNQAEEIACAALKDLNSGQLRLSAGTLRRQRATESQTGLTPHQRRENVRGAFVVAGREQLADRDVLLVDDVFTTGTTAAECARVLRRAGAKRVLVATVARVLKQEATSFSDDGSDDAMSMRAHA